jgi:3-hydroxybutyrate dehydrogenase
MQVNLNGKVAVVTGGASGIGLATAEALATAGASVLIADLNAEGGQAVAAKITAAGGRAMFQVTDVQKSEDVRRLMGVAAERMGGVDILVNDAGLQFVAPIVEYPEDKWNTIVGVMLTGSFLCTKYAMQQMIPRKWGRIINMSSIHGKVASAFKSAYCSAKFGIIGLTRVSALEAAPHGITVNAICPTYTRTPMVEKQIANLAKTHGITEAEVLQKIMLVDAPIKRILEPSEVADLVVYLCSDSASGITGADLSIDCGWTAH